MARRGTTARKSTSEQATENARHHAEDNAAANPAVTHAGTARARAEGAAEEIAAGERSVVRSGGTETGIPRGGDRESGRRAAPAGSQSGGSHKRSGGGSFTTIHPIVRDHKAIKPGERVTFGSDEEEHVSDLRERGYIAAARDAEDALEAADFARGRAEAENAAF